MKFGAQNLTTHYASNRSVHTCTSDGRVTSLSKARKQTEQDGDLAVPFVRTTDARTPSRLMRIVKKMSCGPTMNHFRRLLHCGSRLRSECSSLIYSRLAHSRYLRVNALITRDYAARGQRSVACANTNTIKSTFELTACHARLPPILRFKRFKVY